MGKEPMIPYGDAEHRKEAKREEQYQLGQADTFEEQQDKRHKKTQQGKYITEDQMTNLKMANLRCHDCSVI